MSQPVYHLLGYDRAYPKTPYASQLFGDSPEQTARKASQSREQGYRAVKFGWQNYGSRSVDEDRDHVAAARKGLGDDGVLLIDADTIIIKAAFQGQCPAVSGLLSRSRQPTRSDRKMTKRMLKTRKPRPDRI